MKIKLTSVSLIVLASLMGSPIYAMEEDPEPRSSQSRTPASLEDLPLGLIANKFLPHLSAYDARALDLTSRGIKGAVNQNNTSNPELSWPIVKQKLNTQELLPEKNIPLGQLKNHPFFKKHSDFVKTSDTKTRQSVLSIAFQMARCSERVDKNCKELVTTIEDLGDKRDVVCSLAKEFIAKGQADYILPQILKDIQFLVNNNADTGVIFALARDVSASTDGIKPHELLKTMWELGEDRADIVKLRKEYPSIRAAYSDSSSPYHGLVMYRDLGSERREICKRVTDYARSGTCPYDLCDLARFMSTIGVERGSML